MVTTRDPAAFDKFGCNVIKENPATPDRLPPDIRFDRQGATEIDLMMPDGGYCFAPTHALQDNSPTANVVAMYETARTHGRYQ